MITAVDLQDIKDVFNSVQDDVVCNAITIDNNHDNLYVYLEKAHDDGEPATSKFKIPYSEFLESSNPVAAICFRMEEAHQELIADEEKEMTVAGFDLTAIASDFIKKHPGVCVRFHASYELDALKVRVETKDCKARVDRAIPRVELTSSTDPAWVIYTTLEEAYKELMKENEEKSDDVSIKSSDIRDLILNFRKEHPGVICVISVNPGECFELQLDPGDDRLTQTREVPFWDICYAKDPLEVLWNHLESMYNGLLKEEEDIMPTKGNAMPVDNDYMLKMAKCAVASWYNTHGGPRKIKPEDVYVVWFCKTLQNWKALCSTDIHDGMYYEVTYDGDKDAAYVDAYKKWDNQEFLGENLRRDIWKLGVTVGFIDGKE